MYKIIIQKLRFILDRYEKTIFSRLAQIHQRRIKYFNHVLQGLLRKLEKIIASSPNTFGERTNFKFSLNVNLGLLHPDNPFCEPMKSGFAMTARRHAKNLFAVPLNMCGE